MVILHDDAYYQSRKPQPDLGPLRNFRRFIWNPEKKTFLDRTAKEWGQLGVFYGCFFFVLGAIFAIQMLISVNYVSSLDKPFFQYSDLSTRALLGRGFPLFRSPWSYGSPGIAFRPSSPLSAVSPIIWVSDRGTNARPKRYIRSLTDFLQEYDKNASSFDPNCHNAKQRSVHGDKPCFFDVQTLGPCSKPPYGYGEPLEPCVLVKFNRRFDWVPHYYNQSSDLPEDMPDALKKVVKQSEKFHVWLSCDGANTVDREHVGEIEYIPGPGFPVEFFPFTGQPDYLSPVVALRFKNLTPNRMVTVECTLWALNIDQRSRYSLDFQIIIDD